MECILKDSIDNNYYFTNDNITYYSRRNNKYKDKEKCKKLLNKEISEIPKNIEKITSYSNIIKKTIHLTYSSIPKNFTFYNLNRISPFRILSLSKKEDIFPSSIPTSFISSILIDKKEGIFQTTIPTTFISSSPTEKTEIFQIFSSLKFFFNIIVLIKELK